MEPFLPALAPDELVVHGQEGALGQRAGLQQRLAGEHHGALWREGLRV